MKKILRTAFTMVVLTVVFVFYMKWFNEPLARCVSNFIFQAETQINSCDTVSGNNLDEREIMTKLESIERHMNNLENLIELQNAKIIPDQFDTTMIDNNINMSGNQEDDITEEELFEEFKKWMEERK